MQNTGYQLGIPNPSLLRDPSEPTTIPPDDQKYYEMLSNLLSMNPQQPQNPINPLGSVISSETQLLLKSLVMQDLFTNAFKRFLHSSKPRILQNINQSLGINTLLPPPAPTEVLRRHSETKRKSTDLMSNETIESDMIQSHGTQGIKKPSGAHKQQKGLSAFYPTAKTRSLSMNTGNVKDSNLEWDPREEKKQ